MGHFVNTGFYTVQNTAKNTYTWFQILNIKPSSICETPNITDIFFLKELVNVILFAANCHTYRTHNTTHNTQIIKHK